MQVNSSNFSYIQSIVSVDINNANVNTTIKTYFLKTLALLMIALHMISVTLYRKLPGMCGIDRGSKLFQKPFYITQKDTERMKNACTLRTNDI